MNSTMSDKLNEAAANVATWRDRVRTLNENIAKAEAVAATSVRSRQENLLAASLGDSAAKENLSAVLEDDRRAERELEDLRLALPLATSKLTEAEATHRAAEVEWRKAEVNRLARERCAAAAAIDQAFAMFSEAWGRYEDLGKQLFNAAADDHAGNIHSFSETCDGMLRLAAALPHEPFYSLRWRHSFAQIGGGAPLAVSESAFWGDCRRPMNRRPHDFI
jgi:hypothetical protein